MATRRQGQNFCPGPFTNLLARLFTTFTKTSYSNQKEPPSPFAFLIYNCASTLTLFFLIAVINNWHPLLPPILYSIKRRVTEPRRLLIPNFGRRHSKGARYLQIYAITPAIQGASVIYRHGSLERKSAAILHGNAKDISIIYCGLPQLFNCCPNECKERVRFFLIWNCADGGRAKRAFQASLEETNKQLTEMLNKIGGKRQ